MGTETRMGVGIGAVLGWEPSVSEKGGKLAHISVHDDDDEDRTAKEAKQAVRLNLADANTILRI